MFSSIEVENRREVINHCYWPLFKLADAGIPFGVEAPGVTLELIQDIDSEWIAELSKYIKNGKIEFIGSGYSQIIGPLIPAKVNKWNQKLGLEYYEKLLTITPKLALVNEMAYSGGVVEHYQNTDYRGIIMEWNNPRSAHPEWENEWRYHPQKVIGTNGETLPLIWADSIVFQKFQRYAHGEYELDQYVKYIKSHIGESDRFFPLYANDVEIFDYRPGRYQTEVQFGNNSEWDRIIDLYKYLKQQDWCEFIFPSNVLNGLNNENGGKELVLESPAQPITVKKQEKYNINRWALTGRDDLGINSKCYKIYNSFVENDNNNPVDWKELSYLWSSDFRTHITEKRWDDYCNRLNLLLKKNEISNISNNEKYSECPKVIDEKNWLTVENDNYKVILNKNKGLTIQNLVFKKIGKESLLGTLEHGYFDDISLGADYYSGHAVIERPSEHKITDLGKVDPEIVETDDSITLNTTQEWGNYKFKNSIQINSEKVIIIKKIKSITTEKSIIRPYNITFNLEAWDRHSLYIETHNGGANPERFCLKGQNISHADIYSSLISARHGFGNTNGIVVIGDNKKTISFVCDMAYAALIPKIIYKEMEGTYFFRLLYSGREMDETIKPNNVKHIIFSHIEISIV